MRRTQTPAPVQRPQWGARLMLYGAVALILASGFSLYNQVDTSRDWLDGLIRSNQHMGTSWVNQLVLMFQTSPRMQNLAARMLYLLALVVVAILVMLLRRRTPACGVLILVCLGCFWGGQVLGLYSLRPDDWLRLLYAAPLAVIILGCGLQLGHALMLRRGDQRPAHKRVTRQRSVTPPPIQRTASDKPRQYYGAPGATRMVPGATQQAPQRVQPARRPVRLTLPQRTEKPVPTRQDSHVGAVPAEQEPKPRYTWKTIKKPTDDHRVIHP